MGEVARCNPDLGELAYAGKHLQMRTALHPGAYNRQHAGVRAGQKPGREGSRTSRAQRSDVGPVHDRERGARLGIEQANEGLVPRDDKSLIAMKDGDQLDGDFSPMLVGRHGEQKPGVGDGDLIAFRSSNEAVTERLESLSQCVQERVRVQQSLDLRFIEHQDVHNHPPSFSSTKSASSRICASAGTYTPPYSNAFEGILSCVISHTSQSCRLTISKISTASIGSKPGQLITSGSKSQSQVTRVRSGPCGCSVWTTT